ncbi:polysaccharide deacetylase family protein [Desulfosporosinus sp. OT]|uniref:polysaccharide deacetylase family protein n=1 Tax=Desulfosporosinus sp. OT TaxID=913865 RepID=UPI000223A670|nr:polysaccharide deacetylase family protein [Desulfosporosinus sp. OT]EGW37108.1 polysaccharide deacetylase family protein [Desulfosporosinus sp. OT]
MGIKHWQRWRVTVVMLMLLTSVYLGGCVPVTISTADTTTGPLQTPTSPGSESPQVPTPEPIPEQRTEPIPEQKAEPIPEQETEPTPEATETIPEQETELTPEQQTDPIPEQKDDILPPVHADESDDNPAPTPPAALPQTPIHPYYLLSGTPPSAPGLAMRVRAFNVEPKKIAYLTFDDGPYPQTTPRILKILQDEGVKATFFVLGRQVEKYPDLLKAEYEQGEGIGNHSYSHDYNLLYRSPETFLAEIKQTEELIFKTIKVRPKIVRAPGGTQGHFHVNYYNALDAADYLIYDWNVSSGDADASLVPAEQLVQNVENQVPGKARTIILMHDAGAKVTTIDALPQIIQYLKQQGYSFGVITPKVAPILFPGGFQG